MRWVRHVIYIVLLATAVTVNSAPSDAPNAEVFSRHDENRDGFVDRREYYRFHQRMRRHQARNRRSFHVYDFDDIDVDRNGLIDRDELLQRLHRHPRRGDLSR